MILFHSLPNICWLLNIFELRSIDKRESFVFLTQNVQVRKAKHTTTSLANQRTGERKAFFDRKLVNNQSKERVMKIETECKYGSGSWSVFLLRPCWEQLDHWGIFVRFLGGTPNPPQHPGASYLLCIFSPSGIITIGESHSSSLDAERMR